MIGQSETSVSTTCKILMDTFCILNCELPADKITVSQLTKKAGYDRTTFYQYFFDIKDLQKTVEEDFIVLIKGYRKHTAVRDESFVHRMVEAYQQKPLYFNALLGQYAELDFIYRLTETFKFDLKELHLSDTNQTKNYLIEFHVTTTISLFRLWLQRNQDLSFEELITLIKELYTSGIDGSIY